MTHSLTTPLRLLLLVAHLVAGLAALSAPTNTVIPRSLSVMTDTNGNIIAPTNFFARNAALLAVGISNAVVTRVDTVSVLTNLALSGLTNYPVYQTLGYNVPGDGGGSRYLYDPTDTNAADGALRLLPATGTGRLVSLDWDGNVKRAGAAGDGVTDDSAAIARALEALGKDYLIARSKRLYLPAGNYRVTGPIRLTNNLSQPVMIQGDGQQVSLITQTDTNSPTLVICGYGWTFQDFRITYSPASASPHASGILFVSRGSIGAGFAEVRNVNINNPGVGIMATPNSATAPIGTPALAGATNIALTYISDTAGQYVVREAEMIVPLAAGGSQTVIVQGNSGTNVWFQPPLTGDSSNTVVTLPGAAQNVKFQTIRVTAPGYSCALWRPSDSGSTWENCYFNGNGNVMQSGIAWLLSGASQQTLDGQNNVESCVVSNAVVALSNFSTGVDTLHIEHCTILGSAGCMLRIGANCKAAIQSLEIANYFVGTNLLDTAVLRVDAASRLTIQDLDIRNAQAISNWAAGEFTLVYDSGDATAQIEVANEQIAQDAGVRYRALVQPVSNHRVIRGLGRLVPRGTLGIMRNLRIGSTGDKTIYLHNVGVPESVTFFGPSRNAAGLNAGVYADSGLGRALLEATNQFGSLTSWLQNKTFSLSEPLILTNDLYVNVVSNIFDATVVVSSVSRQRFGTTSPPLKGVCEIITGSAHGLQVGELVFISGSGDSSFDGTVEVIAVPTTTSFRYFAPGPTVDVTADSGIVITRLATVSVFVNGSPISYIGDSD